MLIAEVAVPIAIAKAFSYEVPASLATRVAPGARVLCDFGHRQVLGVVLSVVERAPTEGVTMKPLRSLVEAEPVVQDELLSFLRALARYYYAPIGGVLRLALPAVEREDVERIERGGNLLLPSALSGTKRVTKSREAFVEPSAGIETPGSLRGQARELLAYLRANGGTSLHILGGRFSNARAAVTRLSELGLVRKTMRLKDTGPAFDEPVERDSPPDLTQAQSNAVERIAAALRGETPARSFLLFGVTGSGKTEVYLRAIQACLELGRSAVVLVPEIALTPQLVHRFRARFGDEVAVIHSGLSQRARHEMHERLRSGRVRAAIGARSALFAPATALGLLIVDEEHDGSFKQEEGVRYNARDMALLRAHRAGAVTVLGSATPSLESYDLAKRGKLELLRLPARARAEATLPDVTVVDLRRVRATPTNHPLLSLPLQREIERVLARGEQTILFLNRRGHSPTVVCESCGQVAECATCSVALTFHRRFKRRGGEAGAAGRKLAPGSSAEPANVASADADDLMAGGTLRCHYCGYRAHFSPRCEACSATSLMLEGLGTEKLEDALEKAFPNARVARLDRDVADAGGGSKVLDKMRSREIDILAGTQMVTKGHDFPDVTLVGVVNADAALHMPDFRSAERSFQLLVQVAGRAGRADRPGKVLIQTYSPEHHAISYAKRHDVDGFLERELGDRSEARYPPFYRLALVRLEAVEAALVERTSAFIAERARALATSCGVKVEILGPAPAPIVRLRGRFRFRVLLRAADRMDLRKVLDALEPMVESLDRRVRAAIDVDPVSML